MSHVIVSLAISFASYVELVEYSSFFPFAVGNPTSLYIGYGRYDRKGCISARYDRLYADTEE